jgi:hypothetical protein
MLKLLVFVDVIVEDVMNRRVLRPYTLIRDHSGLLVLVDLFALLSVHDALSEALSAIRCLFNSPPSG